MNSPSDNLQAIQQAFESLDNEMLEVNGRQLKPSQCYHFETDPLHLIFNTNCSSQLRDKLTTIISKYIPG